jgi:leader peptidase (prepilin peptidase)/N-methyltransferase
MGLLGLALLAASVVDARTKRLPNLLTLVVAIAAAELSAGRSLSALIAGVTWAVGVVIVLQGLRLASERFGRDPGLGFGDAKLMGALAMWLGPLTPWMIAGGSALGLAAMRILRPKDGRLPFGPCVALAGWLVGFAVEQGLGR